MTFCRRNDRRFGCHGDAVYVVTQSFLAEALTHRFATVVYADQYLPATGVGKGNRCFDHVGIETLFEFKRLGFAKAKGFG